MYFSMIKKDLKRNKAINVIVLIFVIISTMFCVSSINNFISVQNGIDNFLKKADVKDVMLITRDNSFEDVKIDIPQIKSQKSENIIYTKYEDIDFKTKNKSDELNNNIYMLISINDLKMNYFDSYDKKIEKVADNEIYINKKMSDRYRLYKGDKIKISVNGLTKELIIKDALKDAVFGSVLSGGEKMIISDNTFKDFTNTDKTDNLPYGKFIHIETDDIKAVQKYADNNIQNVVFYLDKDLIKVTYIIDLVLTAMISAIGICMIVIALLMLRFTIIFSIAREYKQIGILKAIGFNSFFIKTLYLSKYFAISVVGAIIGLILSVPFSIILMKNVKVSVSLQYESNIFLNILCAVFIILLIMFFCFLSTKNINKITPIDIIENTANIKKFKNKKILSALRRKIGTKLYMAVNYILSNKKQYILVAFTMFVCMSMILMVSNIISTLKSEEMLIKAGFPKADMYVLNQDVMKIVENASDYENVKKAVDDKMQKIGIDVDSTILYGSKMAVSHNDNSIKVYINFMVGNQSGFENSYDGIPPKEENEIALTYVLAEKLGVTIGDTVTLQYDDAEKEYIVTAFYQIMNDTGMSCTIASKPSGKKTSNLQATVIAMNFKDKNNIEKVDKYVDKIKKEYSLKHVYNLEDTISLFTKDYINMINSVQLVFIFVLSIITLFMIMLISRMLIIKEKNDIAYLKSIGFYSKDIIKVYVYRFLIVNIFSTIMGLILTKVVTKAVFNPIFKILGVSHGMNYHYNLFEIVLIYPIFIIVITLVFSYLSALKVKKVKAKDILNV